MARSSTPLRSRIALAAWPLALAGGLAACGPGDDGPSDSCSGILAGDLVISEVFADADAPPGGSGADEGKEWFEIYNASSGAIDLAGVVVNHSRPDGSSAHTHTMKATTIGAGQYFVLANTLPELVPPYGDYGYGSDLGDLFNQDGGKFTLMCGPTEIDHATYELVEPGFSRSLDGGRSPDYQINDDGANWCQADEVAANEYTPANFGTPGAANQDCMNVIPGQCDDNGTMRPTVVPMPGDLTITEVMPNPDAVGDGVGEWFEVLVNRDVDINDLALDRAGDTSMPVVLSSPTCKRVTAGTRLVFAASMDMATNGMLPRVDGVFNFSLVSGSTATPGDVRIAMGATELDIIHWSSSRAGKAIQLNAGLTAPTDNDTAANLCDATATYGAGDLGTPGAANTACGNTSSGMCMDTGTGMMRATVSPVPGDLTITEVMPDPAAVADGVGEYFEALVNRDIDLNDVGLDRADDAAMPTLITSATCKRVTAGTYVVFAHNADMAMNGMLPRVDGTFAFALISANGNVRLMQGMTELDSITWPSARSGKSIQLNNTLTAPTDNDVAGNLCDSTTAYGAGDLGTPGAMNGTCMSGGNGMCMDTGTMMMRAIRKPMMGQIAINEVMPDPAMVADAQGEWFELKATADFDLNGLQVGTATLGATPIVPASGPCVPVPTGGYSLYAHNATPATNGGLMNVTATFGNALTNSNGQLRIGWDNMVLSTMTWATSAAGKAIMLDSDGTQCNAPAGVASYNGGMDFGTPRAANSPPECP